MTQASRIRKNYFFSLISISSRLIANVIVFWIIGRYYGPTLFGQLAFAQMLATIFIVFADFGFDILLTNEIAKNRSKAGQYFQQYFTLKIMFTLVSIVGMWFFAIIKDFSPYSRVLIFIFSFYMAFTALTNFLYAFFKGFEKLEYETKVSLYINLSLLVCIILFIIFNADLIYIALIFVFTRIFGFFIAMKYSTYVLKNLSFKPLLPKFKEEKSKILVYGLHLVFSYLFFQLDTILLAFLKGSYEVGIYQSVFKVTLIFLALPEIFVNALLPVLSRLNVENRFQWSKVGKLMNKILFIVIIPISITLFVFAENIINLIYGFQNYVEAVPVLRVFAIIIFVRYNLETFALMLTTSNRQYIRMYVVIIASILNIILNYLVIPHYGVYGAAIVSLITNTFVGLIYIFANHSLFKEWMLNIKIISVIILALISTLLLWVSKNAIVFYSSPIFIVMFFVFAYFYFFSKEEKSLIFSDKLNFINLKIR
jgi:O-antigen/teichoic acid export membrane protein